MEYPLVLSFNPGLHCVMHLTVAESHSQPAPPVVRCTEAAVEDRHDKGNIISRAWNCNRKGAPDGAPCK